MTTEGSCHRSCTKLLVVLNAASKPLEVPGESRYSISQERVRALGNLLPVRTIAAEGPFLTVNNGSFASSLSSRGND